MAREQYLGKFGGNRIFTSYVHEPFLYLGDACMELPNTVEKIQFACEPIALSPYCILDDSYNSDTKPRLGAMANHKDSSWYATQIGTAKELAALYDSGFTIRQSTYKNVYRRFIILDYDFESLESLCVRFGKDLAWCNSRSTESMRKFLIGKVSSQELSMALYAKRNCENLDAIPDSNTICVRKSPSAVFGHHPYRRKVFIRLHRPILEFLDDENMNERMAGWERLSASIKKALVMANAKVKKLGNLKGWVTPDMAMSNPIQLTYGMPQPNSVTVKGKKGIGIIDHRAVSTKLHIEIKPVNASDIIPGRNFISRHRTIKNCHKYVATSCSKFFARMGEIAHPSSFLPHVPMTFRHVQTGKRHTCAIGLATRLTVNAIGQMEYLKIHNLPYTMDTSTIADQAIAAIVKYFDDASTFLKSETSYIVDYVHALANEAMANIPAFLSKYKARISYIPKRTRTMIARISNKLIAPLCNILHMGVKYTPLETP